MDERKNRPDPTHGYQNQTFVEHFTANFDTQRVDAENNSENTNEPEHNPQREPTPPEALMRAWEHITEHANAIMAVFTILLFFSTTAYTVIAILQWNAMRDQLVMAYRPRLLITGIDPYLRSAPDGSEELILNDEGIFGAQVILPNTGVLVAKNVRFFRFSDVGLRDQLKKSTYQEILSETKVVPPKVENFNPNHIIFGTRAINTSEAIELKKGGFWYMFSVLVSYEDDFGNTHHTEYCGRFTLPKDRREPCPWSVQND
jgi:hypothetical protein